MERDPVSYGRGRVSEMVERERGREGEQQDRQDELQTQRGRESFHTWRQPGDLGLKDTETSSAAKGDRPKEQ